MNTKINTLNIINQNFLIAVVRGSTPEEAFKAAQACIKGGFKTIELTFTVPHAEEVISKLKQTYNYNKNIVIGAGTVLDDTTARLAILSHADFIVGPTFNKKIALLSNLYQIPYIPGCMTTTEITNAMSYGADIIKVFPGNVVGTKFISSILGPIPNANLMPTGGVNLNNISEWIKSGVAAVGIGGDLVGSSKDGNFTLIEQKAKQYVNKVKIF